MKYLRKGPFTVPSGGSALSDDEWDQIWGSDCSDCSARVGRAEIMFYHVALPSPGETLILCQPCVRRREAAQA